MAKEVTREQAATKKQQAAELMERTGQPDRAQEFRSMSVEQYANIVASVSPIPDQGEHSWQLKPRANWATKWTSLKA